MSDARVVILDGTPPDDGSLAPILSILTEVFGRGGAETRVLAVRDMKIAHCFGCFGCWVETPGICVENDEGREIARAVARSEVAVSRRSGGISSRRQLTLTPIPRMMQRTLASFASISARIPATLRP